MSALSQPMMSDSGPVNYNSKMIQPDIVHFGDLKRNFKGPMKLKIPMKQYHTQVYIPRKLIAEPDGIHFKPT